MVRTDATGGVIGSPGTVLTSEFVSYALNKVEESTGAEPAIIGVRVSGIAEASRLGDLEDEVHTRAVVAAGASLAMTPPEVDDDPVIVGEWNQC